MYNRTRDRERSVSGSGSTIDSLNLTFWYETNYTASPWVGKPSAGPSGTINLSGATAPTTRAINGRTAPDFNGTTQSLSTTITPSFLVRPSSYSGWALFIADTVPVEAASSFSDPAIFTSNTDAQGVPILSVGSSGGTPRITISPYAGGAWLQYRQTIALAALQCFQYGYDGTNLKYRVNGGVWTTVATGNLTTGAGTAINVGVNFGGTVFFDGALASIGLSKDTFSDGTHDMILAELKSRYNF
jgi:hypothetical protein